jgi:rod shape-determining protein MreD
MRYGTIIGLFSGLTIGLIQDVYAIEALGANALSKCLIGYFTGLLDDKVIKVMPATKVLFLALAFIIHDSIYTLAAGFHGHVFWDSILRKTLPSGIYTLLLGSLVFYFLVTPMRSDGFRS